MQSFLSSYVRSRRLAVLAGSAFLFAGPGAFAQVVEDKAPQPSAKVNEVDKVKDAVPANPAPNAANAAAAGAKSAAQEAKAAADTTKAANNEIGNAANRAGNTTDRAADRANNAANNAADRANNAAQKGTNAADRAANRAGAAADNAADRATNAANNATNRAADANAAQGTRTYSNTPNGAAAVRVNAGVNAAGVNTGVNAAVNAAAANPSFSRVATQLGLNWAANTANALTLSTIAPNSVFANTGFVPGDQFVSFGGTPVTSQAAFYQYLSTVPAGQRIPVVVMRNGQQQTLYWTPNQQFAQLQPSFRQISYTGAQPVGGNTLGIQLDESVTDAAVVASVANGSPAANAGVRQGDQIVALNDQEVHSPAQFASAASQIPAGSPARISVARTLDLQHSTVQNLNVQPAGAVVPQAGPAYVQPVAPVGVQPVGPVGPIRRFRAR